jgi:hypothetical protein
MERQRESCTRTPEHITDASTLQPRPLLVDANVVAYFGDLLLGMKEGLRAFATASVSPEKSSRTGQSNTASSRHQS